MDQARLLRWAFCGLTAAASACLLLSTLFIWADLAFFDSSGFAARSTVALREDAVQQRLSELAAEQLVDSRPVFEAARPAFELVIRTGLEALASDQRLSAAVRGLHRRLFDNGTGRLLLHLAGLAEYVRSQLAVAAPDALAQIEGRMPEMEVAVIKASDARVRLLRLAHGVRLATYVLPAVTAACFVGAVLAAGDKRGALAVISCVLMACSLLLFVGTFAGAELTAALAADASSDAARAVWWAFAKGLWPAALAIAGTGASGWVTAALTIRLRRSTRLD